MCTFTDNVVVPMEKRVVIGLSGLQGSGKSTVARYLHEHHNFHRRSFAFPMKCMMLALGVKAEEMEDQVLKEVAHPALCGHSPREVLIALGEGFREKLNTDFWVKKWLQAVTSEGYSNKVVVEDIRRENEEAAVRKLGGIIVRIERPGLVVPERWRSHATETFVPKCDYVINNTRGFDVLRERVDALVEELEQTQEEFTLA